MPVGVISSFLVLGLEVEGVPHSSRHGESMASQSLRQIIVRTEYGALHRAARIVYYVRALFENTRALKQIHSPERTRTPMSERASVFHPKA
jgi:hypothetical protein